MLIVVDTSVLVALLNPRDQNHVQTLRRLKAFRAHDTLKTSQIAKIEFIGHVTRWKTEKDNRLRKLQEFDRLDWIIEEHTAPDYHEADNWWRQYADWPIDYPDALILATAVRLKAQTVWTYDTRFKDFAAHAAPELQIIGLAPKKHVP